MITGYESARQSLKNRSCLQCTRLRFATRQIRSRIINLKFALCCTTFFVASDFAASKNFALTQKPERKEAASERSEP